MSIATFEMGKPYVHTDFILRRKITVDLNQEEILQIRALKGEEAVVKTLVGEFDAFVRAQAAAAKV